MVSLSQISGLSYNYYPSRPNAKPRRTIRLIRSIQGSENTDDNFKNSINFVQLNNDPKPIEQVQILLNL